MKRNYKIIPTNDYGVRISNGLTQGEQYMLVLKQKYQTILFLAFLGAIHLSTMAFMVSQLM